MESNDDSNPAPFIYPTEPTEPYESSTPSDAPVPSEPPIPSGPPNLLSKNLPFFLLSRTNTYFFVLIANHAFHS